ncbi:MAG: CrcB family protein [Nitriliruptor sp.]
MASVPGVSAPVAVADPLRTRVSVALGGAAGALLRTGLVAGAALIAPNGAVLALVLGNILGAAGLGWLVGRGATDPRVARMLPLLGTGVLGAFTTFSALVDRIGRTLLEGEPVLALAIAAVSIAGGVAAGSAGLRIGCAGRRRGGPEGGRP